MARDELALALARLIGNENKYIQMLRQMRIDLDTTASQIILSMSKKWSASPDFIADAALAFSLGQRSEGVNQLAKLGQMALEEPLSNPNKMILQECLIRVSEFGVSRQEYLLIMLHVLAA
jgi:hypothetical protein